MSSVYPIRAPISLTVLTYQSESYVLSSIDDVANIITLSTTLLQVKERIASIDELAESYQVENQCLYCVVGNSHHYLRDNDRTLMSYGASERDVILHLERSTQRRRLNTDTPNSVSAPQEAREEGQIAARRTPQQARPALLSIRIARELNWRIERSQLLYNSCDELRKAVQEKKMINTYGAVHELQLFNTLTKHLREHQNDMINEATRIEAMSAASSSEHVLEHLHHCACVPSSDVASSCVVCNDDFSGCDLIVKTSCNHVFHRECLKNWMIASDNVKCPLCRSRFFFA